MPAGHEAAVYAGGHTHVQLLRRIDQIHVVNPGSVGLPGVGPAGPELPVNERVDWAKYALVETTDGCPTIAFRHAPLDVMQMREIAAASGMPHLGWWTARWSAGWGGAS